MARLTAPLCYNFLMFIKVTHSEFFVVMKIIDVVPILGNVFTTFFPLLLIVFCSLNFFKVYSRFI